MYIPVRMLFLVSVCCTYVLIFIILHSVYIYVCMYVYLTYACTQMTEP